MRRKDLTDYLTKIAEDKHIPFEEAVEAFKVGMEAGCKKEYSVGSCRVDVNTEKNEFFVYMQQEVIDPANFDFESVPRFDHRRKNSYISISEAKKIKKSIKVGDILETPVNPADYNLDAAKEVKNRLRDYLTKAHLKALFNTYSAKINQMIIGRVISTEYKGYRLDLGNDCTTLLDFNDCLQKDRYHVGDRVNVVVLDVDYNETRKGEKLIIKVSRIAPELVVELFKNMVPEINDGTVKIMGICRDAGDRTKLAVMTTNQEVDPIGACIGEAGSRIRGVRKALNNENVDLFKWSEDPKELITNALQPAQISAVVDINPLDKTAVAIVKDTQLSLAIGKKGQNVRLAVKAISWNNIDIISESQAFDEGIVY